MRRRPINGPMKSRERSSGVFSKALDALSEVADQFFTFQIEEGDFKNAFKQIVAEAQRSASRLPRAMIPASEPPMRVPSPAEKVRARYDPEMQRSRSSSSFGRRGRSGFNRQSAVDTVFRVRGRSASAALEWEAEVPDEDAVMRSMKSKKRAMAKRKKLMAWKAERDRRKLAELKEKQRRERAEKKMKAEEKRRWEEKARRLREKLRGPALSSDGTMPRIDAPQPPHKYGFT